MSHFYPNLYMTTGATPVTVSLDDNYRIVAIKTPKRKPLTFKWGGQFWGTLKVDLL